MTDLSTTYMGLQLRNPIIAGSSGLMNNVEYLKELEEAGAGAVVLKSIFEEQIRHESASFLQSDHEKAREWKKTFDEAVQQHPYAYEEAEAYVNSFAKEHTLERYLAFVAKAKQNLNIPVIASIHCVSQYDWSYFAKRIQEAGADAIELNIYVLPSDINRSGAENEQVYFDVAEQIKKQITIPFSLKIGYYFSSVVHTITKLSESGASGLVLFNRPYHPDIDIRELEISTGQVYTTFDDYLHTLRWVAILSGMVKCDICASTGIHSYDVIIKQILAGATAIQIASALYKQGSEVIPGMLKGIKTWMEIHDFQSIDQFKGMFSQKNIDNPAAFERVQFMKLYSRIE